MKSTLCSSGFFFQTEDNKYYFKEKEGLNYIIKVTEKVLTKKLEKNIKDSKTSTTAKTSKNSKSTSSVNNNFNTALSFSSINTQNYFANNTKNNTNKKEEFSQNALKSNLYENKKATISKPFKKKSNNLSVNNNFKQGNNKNNINSFNFENEINDKNKFTNNNKGSLCNISNFNKYDYINQDINDSNILANNLLPNEINNNQNSNNSVCNNTNNRNIKKR